MFVRHKHVRRYSKRVAIHAIRKKRKVVAKAAERIRAKMVMRVRKSARDGREMAEERNRASNIFFIFKWGWKIATQSCCPPLKTWRKHEENRHDGKSTSQKIEYHKNTKDHQKLIHPPFINLTSYRRVEASNGAPGQVLTHGRITECSNDCGRSMAKQEPKFAALQLLKSSKLLKKILQKKSHHTHTQLEPTISLPCCEIPSNTI